MGFGGIFKQGIVRSIPPVLFIHESEGVAKKYINGQYTGETPFIPNQWTEIFNSLSDSIHLIEISDIGTSFFIGIGEVGNESELFFVENGFSGVTSLNLKAGERLVIKPLTPPLPQTFTLFNFYKPSTALNHIDTGRAFVYHNNTVRALKGMLSINDKAVFLTGSHDPKQIPTFGLIGWFYFKTSPTGGLFIKTDNGISINWRKIGRDVEINSFDELYDVDLEGLLDGMALVLEERPSVNIGGTGNTFVPAYIVEAISKPKILSPMNGSTNVPAVTNIELSPFYSPYNYTHVSTHWVISLNQDFTDLVLDEESTTDLTSKTIILEEDKQYWIKVRYKDSGGFESRWAYSSFRIRLEYIVQPTITYPVDQQINVPLSGNIIASDFFPIPDPTISQDEADWQISLDESFTNIDNIVIQSMNDTINLNTFPYSGLQPATTYFVRVRYRSYTPTYNTSEWSPIIMFSTIN